MRRKGKKKEEEEEGRARKRKKEEEEGRGRKRKEEGRERGVTSFIDGLSEGTNFICHLGIAKTEAWGGRESGGKDQRLSFRFSFLFDSPQFYFPFYRVCSSYLSRLG